MTLQQVGHDAPPEATAPLADARLLICKLLLTTAGDGITARSAAAAPCTDEGESSPAGTTTDCAAAQWS
jgi:hypothetical protein